MASYNRVILMGNLTRDPELRHLPNNTPVVDIGLAVNDRYKDRNSGEYIDRPNYIDCTAFGQPAESIARFFAKGRPILIEGKLRYEQWDDKNTGQKRSKIKVVIDQWTFCDSKRDAAGGGGGGSAPAGGNRPQSAPATNYAAPSGGPAHEPIAEDDIPF